MENKKEQSKSLVPDEEVIENPIEIESLCPACKENGITKLISINIPFYRQVIVMSFYCGHCGNRNSNLQSGEQAQVYKIIRLIKQSKLRNLVRK